MDICCTPPLLSYRQADIGVPAAGKHIEYHFLVFFVILAGLSFQKFHIQVFFNRLLHKKPPDFRLMEIPILMNARY